MTGKARIDRPVHAVVLAKYACLSNYPFPIAAVIKLSLREFDRDRTITNCNITIANSSLGKKHRD